MLDEAGCLKSADDRHGNIHENELGGVLAGEANGVATVGGFADDLDIGVGLKYFADGFANDFAVVNDENTQRC